MQEQQYPLTQSEREKKIKNIKVTKLIVYLKLKKNFITGRPVKANWFKTSFQKKTVRFEPVIKKRFERNRFVKISNL